VKDEREAAKSVSSKNIVIHPNFSHTYCHPWRKIKNNLLFIILFSSAVLTLHGLHRNKWEMGILEEIHVGALCVIPTHPLIGK
jgi:hypothetical protein